MKFNKYIPQDLCEFLEEQYKEYIKNTPMTKKEQRALREWVKDGNSVYENSSMAWYDGQIPIPFLEVYREEEYLRQQTKGMSSEEARKYVMSYYGWDDEHSEAVIQQDAATVFPLPHLESDEELPFT